MGSDEILVVIVRTQHKHPIAFLHLSFFLEYEGFKNVVNEWASLAWGIQLIGRAHALHA